MADSLITLSELIADLRSELAKAQRDGQEQLPRLRVQETELELQMVVGKEVGGGGGVKFWVYNAEAKGTLSDQTIQTIRIKLKPLDDGNEDFDVSATEQSGE